MLPAGALIHPEESPCLGTMKFTACVRMISCGRCEGLASSQAIGSSWGFGVAAGAGVDSGVGRGVAREAGVGEAVARMGGRDDVVNLMRSVTLLQGCPVEEDNRASRRFCNRLKTRCGDS